MTIKPWFARMARRGIEQAKKDALSYGGRNARCWPALPWGAQPAYEGNAYSNAYMRTYAKLIEVRFQSLTEEEADKLQDTAAYWRATFEERKYWDVQQDLDELKARVKVLENI